MFETQGKMRLKKSWIAAALLLGCILTAFAFSVGLGATTDPQIAPVNPQYVNYSPSTDLGYRPSLMGTTYLKTASLSADQLKRINANKSFNLGTKDTPVKDQVIDGTDWAFAALGSLESCLMPTGTDFSENNLLKTHGFEYAYNQGGNAFMATAYLAGWKGPLSESDDSYQPDATPSNPLNGGTVRYHVQEVLQIADQSKNEIKNAIMTYGGVYTTMYYDGTKLNDNNSYYDSTKDDWSKKGNNRAVVIVGWDDTYDKNKFSTIPAGPGAWIVKNSRGTSWGQEGYFYVSYYDLNFARENFVFVKAEPTNKYQYKYEYDPYGLTRPIGYQTSTAWAANVFTTNDDSNQSLVAAAFYALQPNTAYTLSIYTGISDDTNPTYGTLKTTQTGTVAMAGYHTIQLAKPVKLTNNQKFSVVVKLTTPGYNYPIPLETKETCNNTDIYAKNDSANQYESFISSTGSTWTDASTLTFTYDVTGTNGTPYTYKSTLANVCIKAFTRTAPVIFEQPASQTVGETKNVTFSVLAEGDPTGLKYQWYNKDGIIGGAESSSYTINGVTTANAGDYYVVVTNDKDSATSAKATLTVLPLVSAPTFNPGGGLFKTPWQVKVSCGTPGVIIRYTTDGNEPTEKSPVIANGGFVKISKDTTLKAKAWKTGWFVSDTKSNTFTITGTVATPIFSLKPGFHKSGDTLIITSTEGAVIHYTLDGTEPIDKPDNIYPVTGITLTNDLNIKDVPITVKAKAWKTGWDLSATATATYTITGKVATPVLDPVEGTYHDGIKVTAKSDTEGATIRYTTGTTGTFTDPTAKSPIFPSNGLVIGNEKYIKVKAFKTNWLDSDVTSAHYTFDQVAAPVFSPAAGTYFKPQTVTISCPTAGAKIYYSTDDGKTHSQYTAGKKIPINEDTTFIAYASNGGTSPDSAISSAEYQITGTVPTPTLTPSKTFVGSQQITMACDTSKITGLTGVKIYYTYDGTEPVKDPLKEYTDPITIDIGHINGPLTVKAKAFADNWASSATATATYTPVIPAPVFTVTDTIKETHNSTEVIVKQIVKINCPLGQTTIRYTTDGKTPPGATSPVVPDDGIVVDHTMTIKVAAFRTGWVTSYNSAQYTIDHVLDPVFSPSPGTYYKPQALTISCATPGAIIGYRKFDGLVDKEAILEAIEEGEITPIIYKPGTKIPITSGITTIVAQAIVPNKDLRSEFVFPVYKVTGSVAAPTFSPGPTTIKAGGSQKVILKSATPGASILYTTDGSTPTPSYGIPYTNPIELENATTTIKAIAILADYVPSPVTTAVYTGTLKAPQFDKPDKTQFSTETQVNVKPDPADAGAVVRYTTNGTNPSVKSPEAPSDGILVNRAMTIKAQAFKTGWAPSAVVTNTYGFTGVATPIFNIPGGVITKATKVTLSCPTAGAVIYYTNDGSVPTKEAGQKFTPGKTTITVGSSVTLKAKAWTTTGESDVATAEFDYTGTVETPALSAGAGSYSVPQALTISCNTSGANIYYTTNGKEPSAANGTLIASGGTVDIVNTTTLKVKAFKDGYTPSATVTAVYTIGQVSAPTFSPDAGTFNPGQPITLNCATAGAKIYYTTNGNDPTLSDPWVTPGSKINIGVGEVTIRARAWKAGLTPSDIALVTYEVEPLVSDTDLVTINNRLASVAKFTEIANYLHAKFYHFLFFNRFVLGNPGEAGAGEIFDKDLSWSDEPDTDGWYTATDGGQSVVGKMKSPNPGEIYLKTSVFNLAAKRGADGLWDGSINVDCDSSDDYETSSQYSVFKYHVKLAVNFTDAALDKGEGTYQVTGVLTVPGKPAYQLNGTYKLVYDTGLLDFTVTGTETFNKATKNVDDTYSIVPEIIERFEEQYSDPSELQQAKDALMESIQTEINNRLEAVKAFNLIPDYLKDKLGNFIKTMDADDFKSSDGYPPNTGTEPDFAWQGLDSDGWYIYSETNFDDDQGAFITKDLKFKSANAGDVRFSVAVKTQIQDGPEYTDYGNLTVTRGSNHLWSGTYDTTLNYPAGQGSYYRVNLSEQFSDADLSTGDGTYDVTAACEIPGEPYYTLNGKYGFDAGTGNIEVIQETLGRCSTSSLSSDQINKLLNSFKMFQLAQKIVEDNFINFLITGEFSYNIYNEGTMPALVWSAPNSAGVYTSKVDGGIITFQLISDPYEIKLTTIQGTKTILSFDATRSGNLWRGEYSNNYSNSITISHDGSSPIDLSYHVVFSEDFENVDFSTGAGTYRNVSATFTGSNLRGQSEHQLKDGNYVYTFNPVDSSIRVTGSEKFDGVANNNVDLTYQKWTDDNNNPPGDGTWQLTINKIGNGSTNPSGAITIHEGETRVISATPDPGYMFVQWIVDSGSTGSVTIDNPSSASVLVSVSGGDAVIQAVFAVERTLTITNDGNGYTVPSGSVTVADGYSTSIEAIVPSGCVFVNWTVVSGSENVEFGNANLATTTVTVTGGDATIQANYERIDRQLTILTDGNGSTDPSGTITVKDGEQIQIDARAGTEGYIFDHWEQVGGSGIVTFVGGTTFQTTWITVTGGDATVRAYFVPYNP